MAFEPERIHVHVHLARLAAEPDHVDDAGNLAELAFEDPVLRGLELGERISGPAQHVTVDFPDRVPRRELRLHSAGQLDELQPVDDALLRLHVAGVPVEVALHVGEAEQRLRADVLQVEHARETVLQRDGDVPLHFLGR